MYDIIITQGQILSIISIIMGTIVFLIGIGFYFYIKKDYTGLDDGEKVTVCLLIGVGLMFIFLGINNDYHFIGLKVVK